MFQDSETHRSKHTQTRPHTHSPTPTPTPTPTPIPHAPTHKHPLTGNRLDRFSCNLHCQYKLQAQVLCPVHGIYTLCKFSCSLSLSILIDKANGFK